MVWFINHPCFNASVRTLYSPITKTLLKTWKVDHLPIAVMASGISSLLLEFLIAFEICIFSNQRSHWCAMKHSAKWLWKDDAQPTSYQGHAIICHFMVCWWMCEGNEEFTSSPDNSHCVTLKEKKVKLEVLWNCHNVFHTVSPNSFFIISLITSIVI